MSQLPQISDAEFEVMHIIWREGPLNTNDIIARLAGKWDWSPKTIQTMLSRLEKKGVVQHEKDGRIFVYEACIPEWRYLQAEGQTFLNRFFDGTPRQMVVRYLDQNDLSLEELDELQAILERKREQVGEP